MSRQHRRRALTSAVSNALEKITPRPSRPLRSGPSSAGAVLELLETRQLLSIPAAPSNPSAGGYYPGAIMVSWQDNSNNETDFLLQYATNYEFTYDVATLSIGGANGSTPTTASTPITGLIPGAPYYVRIRAANAEGSSAYTDPPVSATAALGGATADVPTGLSASVISANQINLSWTDVVGGQYGNPPDDSGYVIERATRSDFRQDYARFPAGHNGTSYQDAGLSPNTTYYYRLRSVSSNGWSAPSEYVSRTTQSDGNQSPTVATAAAASPAPVPGTTTALSVLGADDGGEANLSYTWSVAEKPAGAADPTFSVNGSNAAQSTTATFSRAGSYRLTVTLRDLPGATATSSVSVTVNQTLSGITLAPATIAVESEATQQFTATALDQFNQALTTQPGFTWTVEPTSLGTISGNGLLTAGMPGSGTVRATSGGFSGTAALTVTAVGAPVTWDGEGDGVSWGDALNWSTNQVPTATKDVVLNVAATPTITVGSGTYSVHSLTSYETLQIQGKLTVGGGLDLHGNATVASGGTLEFAGTQGISGSAQISTAGTLALTTGSTLTIGSQITLRGSGAVQITMGPPSATLVNQGTILGEGALQIGTGIVNSGTLRATSGQLTATQGWTNTSSGTIEAAGGEIRYLGAQSNSGVVKVVGSSTIAPSDAPTYAPIGGNFGALSGTELSGSWYGLGAGQTVSYSYQVSSDGTNFATFSGEGDGLGGHLFQDLPRSSSRMIMVTATDSATGGRTVYQSNLVSTLDRPDQTGRRVLLGYVDSQGNWRIRFSTPKLAVSGSAASGAYETLRGDYVTDGTAPMPGAGANLYYLRAQYHNQVGETFSFAQQGAQYMYDASGMGMTVDPSAQQSLSGPSFFMDMLFPVWGTCPPNAPPGTPCNTSSPGFKSSFTSDGALLSDDVYGSGVLEEWVPTLSRLNLDANGDRTLQVIFAENDVRSFERSASGFAPTAGLTDGLVHTGSTYVMTTRAGDQYVFHDFSVEASLQGRLLSSSDAAGNANTFNYVSGKIAEVQRRAAGATSDYDSWLLEYDTPTGQISRVTQRRWSGGAWQTYQVSDFSYYSDGDAHGSAYDRKMLVISDGSGAVKERNYYRYYTAPSSTGYAHGLQYQFDDAGYARLNQYATEQGKSVEQLSESDLVTLATGDQMNVLRAYAQHFYEYDADRRVITHATQSTGCSGSCGGVGTNTYQYSTIPVDFRWFPLAFEQSPVPGTTAGFFVKAAPDPSRHYSYALVSGPGDMGNSYFEIGGSRLAWAVGYYEVPNVCTIRVRTIEFDENDVPTGRTWDRVIDVTGAPQFVPQLNDCTRPSAWYTRTIETLNDGNQNITYSNLYGQPLLKLFWNKVDGVTPALQGEVWGTFYRYDDDGRLVWVAQPSALNLPLTATTSWSGAGGLESQLGSTIEAFQDLLHLSDRTNDAINNPDYEYLNDSTGEIAVTEYYQTTGSGISETVWGGVAGYVAAYKLQEGELGAPVPLAGMDYFARSAGGATLYPVAHYTSYANGDGTGARTTSYSYTWAEGTIRMTSQTVSHPVVATNHNGSGTGTSATAWYDTTGRAIWYQDEEGFLTYTAYDNATGAVIKRIVDVDTNKPIADFDNNQPPITNQGGLHLLTSYEVDVLGRTTKEVDPSGRITYTVYNDAAHEVRTYRGWDTATNLPTGPIEIRREDHAHGYIEVLTSSATPTVESGRPTGREAITAGNIQSLTRTILNEGGQVHQVDAYTSLDGLVYSTELGTSRGISSLIWSSGTATATLAGHGFVVGDTITIRGVDQAAYNGTFTVTAVSANTFSFALTGSPVSPATGSMTVDQGKLGTAGVNYLTTTYDYEKRGRLTRTLQPDGSLQVTFYDGRGNVRQVWKGTDDVPSSDYLPDGIVDWRDFRKWVGSNPTAVTGPAGTNMVKVAEYEYDNMTVGDGHRTKATQYPDATTANSSTMRYDWRGRLTDAKAADGLVTKYTYDNLGEVTKVQTYVDADSDWVLDGGERRSESERFYDALGRVYRQVVHEVKPGNNYNLQDRLATDSWYNPRGMLVKTSNAAGLFAKSAFDGAGRLTASYTSYDTDESGYSEALTVSGDTVIEQNRVWYDGSGNALVQANYQRLENDASSTGELTAANSYASSSVRWYDRANRPTHAAVIGHESGAGSRYVFASDGTLLDTVSGGNGIPDVAEGTAFEPNTSDDYLVSKVEYDAGGRAYRSIDNAGRVTQTNRDLLGRTTATIENYVDGQVSETEASDTDRTTIYLYDSGGRLSIQRALNPKGAGQGVEQQDTRYLYESFCCGSLVTNTIYPDSTDTDSSGTDQVKLSYDWLGRKLTSTDQRGVVHAYGYDPVGRLVSDAVTTLPSGVDGRVRRIGYGYQDDGKLSTVTSYDAASGGNIVNQVKYTYDGWGQLKSEQSHVGAVTTGTPAVTYAYEDGADANGNAQYVRLKSMTYPSGRVIWSIYETTPTGRLIAQSENAGGTQRLNEYVYLGMSTVVQVTRPSVSGGLNLSYGSGGTYAGWDRFGRIVGQEWRKDDGTLVDGYSYTYNRAGDRTTRTNLLNSAYSESYSYDGLSRLVDTNRNGANLQDWGLDALGNWDSTTTAAGTQSRTHNAANETTDVSGTWADPAYDAAGNMTWMPAAGDESTALRLTYDAWNRVTGVMRNVAPPPYESWMTFATYSYDGLGRLINTGHLPGQIELYYNENYQIVEQRYLQGSGGYNRTTQYVWDQRYIDAPVMAFVLEQVGGYPEWLTKQYYLQDANWDVTAAVNGDSGAVTGRAVYTPYGQRTVLGADWSGSGDVGSLGHQGLMLLEDSGETGLYYNRARMYHPTLGRFLQRDPLGYVDGGSLYEYERSRGTFSVDPRGTEAGFPIAPPPVIPPVVIGGGAGAGAGAVAGGGAAVGTGTVVIGIGAGVALGAGIYYSGLGDYIGTTQLGTWIADLVCPGPAGPRPKPRKPDCSCVCWDWVPGGRKPMKGPPFDAKGNGDCKSKCQLMGYSTGQCL